MPTLAIVEGVKIQIYFDDHPPAHFHAVFGGEVVQIGIANLDVLRGSLSATKLTVVRAWAANRKAQLMEAWNAVQAKRNPERIA